MINLKILNANLLASNLDLIDGQEKARLTADEAAASSTIVVDNISGFSDNDYLLLGNFGDTNAEIVQINGAPSGNTITLGANTVSDHFADTKVTLLDYNQIEFSRATTLTGIKTVLGSVQDLNADRTDSAYKDLTNTTGYAFLRRKNEETGEFSSYSTGVNYTGNTYLSVQDIVEKACSDASVSVGDEFSTEKMLLADTNDAQNAVTTSDWKFEIASDTTSLTAIDYENTYSLDGLTYEMKYPGIEQGIKSLKFSSNELDFIDNDRMNELYKDVPRTTVSVEAAIAATSITLTSSIEFASSGVIYAGGFAITYTTNTISTGVLSGISASTITTAITADSVAWQGTSPSLPTEYTIYPNNEVVFNVPVDDNYTSYPIKVEYLKKLTRFTDFSSTTDIPFPEILPLYITAKIELRKRNMDNYALFMKKFEDALLAKNDKYKIQVFEEMNYYKFFDSKV